MAQHTHVVELRKFRERSLAVRGGIKAVAGKMGRSHNTLHNWFNGKTNPAIDDLELLKKTLDKMEKADQLAKEAEDKRRRAILA